jgi:hypothetical protein
MLTATVDFNAQADGLVRGLQVDATGDGDLIPGTLVLLTDGEGNEAFGILRDVRDQLVLAEVDWETWGPATTKISPAPRPEQGKELKLIVSGSVWQSGAGGKLPTQVPKLAERVPVAA